MRWSLQKYKCLWVVEDKSRDSSFQEGVSHTYTLKLGYSRNYILYQKPQVRLILDFVKPIKRLNYKNFKLYSKYLCV